MHGPHAARAREQSAWPRRGRSAHSDAEAHRSVTRRVRQAAGDTGHHAKGSSGGGGGRGGSGGGGHEDLQEVGPSRIPRSGNGALLHCQIGRWAMAPTYCAPPPHDCTHGLTPPVLPRVSSSGNGARLRLADSRPDGSVRSAPLRPEESADAAEHRQSLRHVHH